MEKATLELKILAGAESKAWLADLTKLVNRLEHVAGVLKTGDIKAVDADEDEEEEETQSTAADTDDEDEEDFAPKKTTKTATKATKGKSFDDDEDEDETTDEDEDESFTKAPAKSKKKKAITLDDANDACKARAVSAGGGKKGRDQVLALLKKHFKTESVSDLKPEQYEKLITIMEV